jgi:hypothetical protein
MGPHWIECSNVISRCGARTPNLPTDELATKVWNLMQRASSGYEPIKHAYIEGIRDGSTKRTKSQNSWETSQAKKDYEL